MIKIIAIGLLIPFLGTTIGSAMSFIMKDEMNQLLEKILLGFAGGVMMAASVWSLLIPAMDLNSNMQRLKFLPATIGFLLGIGFLLLLDHIIPHLHIETDEPEGPQAHLKKATMLILAVTIT
jgi:ZIP family zinc transporter